LYAQSQRLRVSSENLANAQTTGANATEDPYRRKTITFGELVDRNAGVATVSVRAVGRDPSSFRTIYDPGHPAADAKGFVRMPNVDPMVELADLREANRSYQANVQVVKQAKDLFSLTIDLLKT
jgi:flagellar basal-body rod protein FlgC